MNNLSRFSLEGKVALVSGGSRGIGRATALGLAEAGADVVVASRKLSDLETVANEIKTLGRNALAVAAHAGKLDDIHKLVEMVINNFGKIDILVNNAGTGPPIVSSLETTEQQWDLTMNLNIKGLYFLSQATARVMKEHGGGKIINVSSISGFVPEYGMDAYCISKAAIIMATKCMALNLADHNIRVNCIAPGFVDTKLFNSRWFNATEKESIEQKKILSSRIPLKYIAYPDEIVGAIIYLASDASSYVTGETILVDGGRLLTASLV